jgi:uncharacterized protein (DUF1800 family)
MGVRQYADPTPSQETPRMPTERSTLAHLYRRAGFGARPEQLDAAVRAGYAATVARLLDFGAPDPAAAAVRPPELTLVVRQGGKDASPQAKQQARKQAREQGTKLTLWWLRRMAAADNPLREKLTLFWHGHFATSIQKVRQARFMYQQNELFRRAGAGPFEALTLAVARDAAMLIWLDGNANRRQSPNENFARELMELFTLGIGNYSEADVKALARCFTGLRVQRQTGAVRFVAKLHDPGPKSVLGRTADFDVAGAVKLLTDQPATTRHLAGRMWSFFARPAGPTDPVVARLAAAFQTDRSGAALLRAILTDAAFTAPETRTGLVKTPIEYVAGALRALRVQPEARHVSVLRRLGQVPFAPPSVGGWPANEAWLTTASSQARYQFARDVARRADLSAVADQPAGQRPDAVAHLLGVDGWSPTTAAALARVAGDPGGLVTIALVAPEYVLN